MIPRQRKTVIFIGLAVALACIVTAVLMLGLMPGNDSGHWAPSPLEQFVIKTEAKYRREENQNDVAIHFLLRLPNTVVVSVSSVAGTDGVKVRSIGEAANELIARLIEEDKNLNQGSINHELEYKTRTPESTQ